MGAGPAAHFGVLALSPTFAWVGTIPALIAFGTASALESGAYYVPWLDHVLDIVADAQVARAEAERARQLCGKASQIGQARGRPLPTDTLPVAVFGSSGRNVTRRQVLSH